MNAAERRAARHSMEHNMKCFAEQQVDQVVQDLPDKEYRNFTCVGVNGEQGFLVEKFNHWIQGWARQERWDGITRLDQEGNYLQLCWDEVPNFKRDEDGTLTASARVAIVKRSE